MLANQNIKTMRKQKFLKPIIPKQKVIVMTQSVNLKKILFCRALSGSINNFEFSLKKFDDDVTVNNAIQ